VERTQVGATTVLHDPVPHLGPSPGNGDRAVPFERAFRNDVDGYTPKEISETVT
jgi:hypothetical protein